MEILTFNYYGEYIKHLKVTEKISLFKYTGGGLFFSIQGLGLTKSERSFFNQKFLKPRNVINVYAGKIGISIKINESQTHKEREEEHLCYSEPLKRVVKNYMKDTKKKLINWFYHKQFKKQYEFIIQRSFSEPKKIKTDMLTAYQLASNYEADLMLNGRYLLSPLGFDWEENAELIKKYLGEKFIKADKWDLKGFADYSDVEIIKEV